MKSWHLQLIKHVKPCLAGFEVGWTILPASVSGQRICAQCSRSCSSWGSRAGGLHHCGWSSAWSYNTLRSHSRKRHTCQRGPQRMCRETSGWWGHGQLSANRVRALLNKASEALQTLKMKVRREVKICLSAVSDWLICRKHKWTSNTFFMRGLWPWSEHSCVCGESIHLNKYCFFHSNGSTTKYPDK